mgnify:FL=1|tara:strand:- start:1162 stop:1647 length:486 start_codon:yes stop_codon:yes gene_type:complete
MNTFFIICLLFSIFIIVFEPCDNFIKSDSGNYYSARDKNTANLLDMLRNISFDLVKELNEIDSKILKYSLRFTSFVELRHGNNNVMATNTDKGREIAIRVYDRYGEPFKASFILHSLFHELAHSLVKPTGHGPVWESKDDELQKIAPKYVDFLIKNTFLTE